MIALAPEVTGSSTNNTCRDVPVVKQQDFISTAATIISLILHLTFVYYKSRNKEE